MVLVGWPDSEYIITFKLQDYNDGIANVTVAGGAAVVKDFALVKIV